MQIYGPAQLHGPQSIGPPHRLPPSSSARPAQGGEIQDEIQISDAARQVEQAQSLPEIRSDRVAAIRAQIAEGTYETPEKLDVALDRLLDELG